MPKKVWKSTDAWRGYYTMEATPEEKAQGWREASYFNIVPHPQNEEFFRETKRILGKRFNIRVYTQRTSNVFSVNKTIWLKPKKSNKWTKEDEEAVKNFDEVFSETYGRAFSIFSGTTSRIDMNEYKEKLKKVV